MTIAEVLTRVKRDRPGESTDAELIQWLSQLDRRWVDEVILTHVPWDPEVRATVTMEDLSTYPGIKASRTDDGVTVVNGSDEGVSNVPIWTARGAQLVEGETYVLSFEELGGSKAIAAGELLNISLVCQNPFWLVMDSVVKPGETATFQAPYTGSYYYGLSVPAAGSVFRDWTTRVRLTKHTDFTAWDGYDTETNRATELLIGEPDEEIYIHWLYAKIDYRLAEIERYNLDAAMFNQGWTEAAKRYNRQHRPLGRIVHRVAYGDPAPWIGDEDPLNQRRGGC